MFKLIRQYRFQLTLLGFVLLPVLALDTATRAPRDHLFHDRVIIALISPVQRLISWTLDTANDLVQSYLLVLGTRRENTSLLEENRKLLGVIVNLREAELENQRLRKLLSFQEQYQLTTIAARVIARDASTEFRAIRINRGSEAGLEKDMAVINSDGIVGRILRVTAETADVVTVLDLLSAVDAVVQRSRVRGIVEGMTDDACQLKFALRTDDIQLGDLLVTSGLGGIFPRGIPVGTVTKVQKKEYGITQNVELRPAVDFSKLEEVLVVKGAQGRPLHAATNIQIRLPAPKSP